MSGDAGGWEVLGEDDWSKRERLTAADTREVGTRTQHFWVSLKSFKKIN